MVRRTALLMGMGVWLAAWANAAPCAPAPSTAARQLEARLDALLEQRREALHIPGLAFVAVQDGCIVYARAFGDRDIESHAPTTLDTLFPIGSATKSFTAMAAALSRDAGLLSLEDHPQAYLPYFHMADPDANARVTLRDMLSHQTGLLAKADLAAVPAVLTREEFIRAATGAQPVAALRTRFQYSNAMFAAAGEAIAAANHATWESVIERRIFAPLAMRVSVANVLREMAKHPDHVTGYVYDTPANTWRPTPPSPTLEALAPAGSIASSANDMAQWLRMLTDGGEFRGRRFVSKDLFRELTTPQIAINAELSYALGWVIYDCNGSRVVEHNGGGEGISALVSFIPAHRTGFVLMSNTSPHDLTTIGNAGRLIYPLLLGAPAAQIAAQAAAPVQESAAPVLTDARLVSADALTVRMVRAAGGASTLARHHSLSIEAEKSYDNQGVVADLTIFARAPAARAEAEAWRAANRQIGALRSYFDGAHGGQETTFGQDALNDAAADAAARRADAFRPLLELRRLYSGRSVSRGQAIAGEATYVLALGDGGPAIETLTISARSGRILRRATREGVFDYDDYRSVDGEILPFRTTLHDGLGQTTIIVHSAMFNTAIPDGAFAPGRGQRANVGR